MLHVLLTHLPLCHKIYVKTRVGLPAQFASYVATGKTRGKIARNVREAIETHVNGLEEEISG